MMMMDRMEGYDPARISHWSMEAANDAGALGKPRARSVRLDKALAVILQRVGEPGLSPNTIASAVHMSRRALYLLFEQHDLTPTQAIRDTRLECCKRILSDPRQQDRKITDIALDFGFAYASTFCRHFKQRYGVSPRELRLASSRPQQHQTRSRISAMPCPTPMHMVHSA